MSDHVHFDPGQIKFSLRGDFVVIHFDASTKAVVMSFSNALWFSTELSAFVSIHLMNDGARGDGEGQQVLISTR